MRYFERSRSVVCVFRLAAVVCNVKAHAEIRERVLVRRIARQHAGDAFSTANGVQLQHFHQRNAQHHVVVVHVSARVRGQRVNQMRRIVDRLEIPVNGCGPRNDERTSRTRAQRNNAS